MAAAVGSDANDSQIEAAAAAADGSVARALAFLDADALLLRQRALEELVRNCYNLMWMISPLVHDAASVDGPKAVSSISEVRTETVELSNQQKRCLALTLQGKTSGQIAEIISRSRVTVEYHLQRAMRQLGVRTKIAAAVYAMKAGIIVV